MAARADSTGAPAMPLAPISSNIIPFNRGGCPEGIEPRIWRKALRSRVQQHLGVVTALLRLLDDLEGDCDLEDGADYEPSLGGLTVMLPTGERVVDGEGDNADLEPSLGAPEIGASLSLWTSNEGTIAFRASQTRWANGHGNEEEEAVNEDGDPGETAI